MVRPRLARASLERAATVWLGVTVVVFTLGSSIFERVKHVAGRGKWAALVVLFVLAVALAWRSRPLRWSRLHVVLVVLLGLMAVSTAWSVAPSTTVKHTISLVFMLGTAAALGSATAREPQLVRRLGGAIAMAAVAVCLAGFVVLVADPSRALLRGASPQPTRLRGLTENPDTMPLLLVLALPFLVLACVEAPTRRKRGAWAAATVLVFVTLILTLSRGGWMAAFAGSVVLLALIPRRRVRLTAALALVVCWGVAASLDIAVVAHAGAKASPSTAAAPSDWARGYPSQPGSMRALSEELYLTQTSGWALLGTSGRAGAWRGTARQAMERPLLGFGFGTENRVFFDRYYNFQGGSAEDSYVGMLLQLGVAGLGLLLAALATAVLGIRGVLPLDRRLGIGLGAALVAGVLLAITESYLYAAGNIAALPFWVLAFAAASVGARGAHV